jgi:hypothetical protein
MARVYRIQDREGRGPWRPGFSRRWIEASSERPLPPALMDEFPGLHAAFLPPYHYGCAVLSLNQLVCDWLLPIELDRLLRMGFAIVEIDDAEIIAESPNQVVVKRLKPFKEGARVLKEEGG